MNKKYFLGLFFLLLFLLILSSCRQEDISVFMLTDTSMEITHLTTGYIDADTIIAVRFREEKVKKDYLEKDLNDIFTFTPEIEGKTYWQDERTIVFEPAAPLYKRKNYHARLDFYKLFSPEDENDIEELEFHFKTTGQDVLSLKGGFELESKNKAENVNFMLELEMSERVTENIMQEALVIELEGRKLDYSIHTRDSLKFDIKSERIGRYRLQDRELIVRLKDDFLRLEEEIEETYILTALESPLTVLRIEEEKQNEFSQLRIVFSDTLKENRDYSGYLNIIPPMDYEVSVDKNSLILKADFRARENYSIELFPGIESVFGQRLAEKEDHLLEVEISDRNPALEFVNPGIFMTSAKDKRINFRTLNVSRLRLQVKRVEEENLIDFFEGYTYRPSSQSFDNYKRYQFRPYGEVVADKILEIGDEMNKWIQSELDLSNIITDSDSALYILQLEFDESQALYFSDDMSNWQRSNYLNSNARAVKHLLLSDIGITVKELSGKYYVFLTDILSTEVLENAIVEIKDRSGEVLDTAYSNEMGLALLETSDRAKYIEVRRGNNYAIMNLDSSVLNKSLFDIGGMQKQDGVNAFIYTERGVYRPGDEINISAIVRNEEDTFPDNHPVSISLYNPQGRLVEEKISTEASDGFYSFNFRTERDALTGNWRAVLELGSRRFVHEIKVEEIVPYRIRVAIDSEQDLINKDDEEIDFTIESEYLFGAPASGLESETLLAIEPYTVSFTGYQNFVFDNDTVDFRRIESNRIIQDLDEAGRAELSWDIPALRNVPSALRLRIDSRVYESGGRAVPRTKVIPISFYDSYVGIMRLENPELSIGEDANFNIVHLDKDGHPLSNSNLEYNIYRMRRYWWWEFNSQDHFRRHYKSNQRTELIEKGSITTNQEGFAYIEHKLEDYGEILLEVRDPEGGHQSAYFFRSYWWGDSGDERSADVVNLRLDKNEYTPGEIAKVSLNTPSRGRALLTVEKGEEILYKRWEDIDSTESVFEIEVKEEYIPNAYISVIVYQEYEEIDNDLPIRMYGILPLNVQSQGTKIDFELNLVDTLRPEEELKVEVQTKDNRPAQFTIAVVDEGLLDITGFRTPEPWSYFFSKQRLLSKSYDNYSDIIDPSHGFIYNLFSIGGDMELMRSKDLTYQEQQAQAQEAQRFEAVTFFKGPIQTDDSGFAEMTFDIPNYIGSLRVMVVGANEGNYGNSEETVTVRSPLMVLETLPRVMGPLDRIRIPVTVFALEDNLGEVKVSIDVEGAAEILGDNELYIEFTEADTQEVFFEMAAKNMIGRADIRISAYSKSSDYLSESNIEMPIRPYNPYIYSSVEKVADSGEVVELAVPESGIAGTGAAQLSISSMKGLNINHRLKWLLRYPYGCLEQTTSAVFPQLYLPAIYDFNYEDLSEIDKNINAAISRMRKYQVSGGGFSYWPNGTHVNQWATNYAGHFLLEARNKGYRVPDDLFDNWLAYQNSAARGNRGNLLTRAYRLYLLAMADKSVLSSMNYMRESELEDMSNTAKFYLAAAYQLLGYEDIREEIMAETDLDVEDYLEFSGTFGSSLRDKAIMLDLLTVVGDNVRGLVLYNEIAEEMSSDKWYSTQATAYSLLALTKYLGVVADTDDKLTGKIRLANMEIIDFELQDIVEIIPIENSFAEIISVENTSDIPLFFALEWEGIPYRDNIEAEQSGLILRTNYYDLDGHEIEIDKVEQGDSFYAVFRVSQEGNINISEVALVQILPAGWEIENLRLIGGELPDWTKDYHLDQEEYLDIRDDRIMWFFDMERFVHSYDFIVKINAITVGEFYLPPTLLEAMYNNDYKVTTEGRKVEVLAR
ncbi:alpha-2-macroglobulin family protein [Natronospora cellulosivora (SeqCode)]